MWADSNLIRGRFMKTRYYYYGLLLVFAFLAASCYKEEEVNKPVKEVPFSDDVLCAIQVC